MITKQASIVPIRPTRAVFTSFAATILAIQYWSYTIYGAGITPAVVGALIWKKATKAGGISSMIVGCGLSIIWEATGSPFGLQTIFVAFPIALMGRKSE